jgi:hypothetical protein
VYTSRYGAILAVLAIWAVFIWSAFILGANMGHHVSPKRPEMLPKYSPEPALHTHVVGPNSAAPWAPVGLCLLVPFSAISHLKAAINLMWAGQLWDGYTFWQLGQGKEGRLKGGDVVRNCGFFPPKSIRHSFKTLLTFFRRQKSPRNRLTYSSCWPPPSTKSTRR